MLFVLDQLHLTSCIVEKSCNLIELNGDVSMNLFSLATCRIQDTLPLHVGHSPIL
jgi:hypothetical protein